MSTAERRPPAGEAAPDSNTATATIPQAADIPAQLRRRRAASYRLVPLDDGRRDPHDPNFWMPSKSSNPWHCPCPDCEDFRGTYAALVRKVPA